MRVVFDSHSPQRGLDVMTFWCIFPIFPNGDIGHWPVRLDLFLVGLLSCSPLPKQLRATHIEHIEHIEHIGHIKHIKHIQAYPSRKVYYIG